MGIKSFFGIEDKGLDCEDNTETGARYCRAMIRHKNSKLATGSSWEINIDQKSCHATLVNRSSIFDDDADLVKRSLKQAEADCRGGIN